MTAKSPYRIVVLASGRGSNLEQLLERFCTPGSPVQIAAVVSDNPLSKALKLARERGSNFGVAAIAVDRQQFTQQSTGQPTGRADYDRALVDAVAAQAPDLIVLAGYMRLLDASFIKRFHRKIINIHPSLLPAFKGLNAQQQALAAGVRIAGCTVHFVDVEVDSGPIIAQGAVPVLSDDSVESLSDRILAVEHQLLPAVVKLFACRAITVTPGNHTGADKVPDQVTVDLPADELTLRTSAQNVLKGV